MEGALVLEMLFVPRLLRVRPEAARMPDGFADLQKKYKRLFDA